MEARVKEKSRISTVTAGGGQYFVKPEWSHVEVGTEAEIRASEFLDVRNEPVAVDEFKPKAKGKSKPKKKAEGGLLSLASKPLLKEIQSLDDRELLDAMGREEASGQARKTVLAALEKRLKQLEESEPGSLSISAAHTAMAESLDKSVEELTDEEKAIAILNETIRKGAEAVS